MSTQFKYYKRKFKNALAPLFVMLIAKRNKLSERSWLTMIQKTARAIVDKPNEYLGAELPGNGMTCDIVYEIFEQFYKEKVDVNLNGFSSIANNILRAKIKSPQSL